MAPVSLVLLGFIIGIIIVRILDFSISHMGIVKVVYEDSRGISKTMLIALAIAIQDVPEGLAIAVVAIKFGNSSKRDF